MEPQERCSLRWQYGVIRLTVRRRDFAEQAAKFDTDS